jgi:hypothetical protein
MAMLDSKPVHHILDDAYNRRISVEGLMCQQKQKILIQCEFCKEKIQTKTLKQHHQPKRCHEAKKQLPINQKLPT